MGSHAARRTRTTIGGGSPTADLRRGVAAGSPTARPTDDFVLAFANAIAQPHSRALLIDSNNKKDGWASIEDAVASGRAFAVEVRKYILALDADRPDLSRALEAITAEMRHDGLRPVVVASGQEDHRHLFCRIADRGRWKYYCERARAAGIDVRSGSALIRPPLAPHRLGLRVVLLEPTNPDEALAALAGSESALDRPDPQPLSPRMQHLLETGEYADYGYQSRSEMVLGLTLAAVNAGWTEKMFLNALLDPKNAAGEKVREKRRPEKYVSGCWRKALARVAARPPVGNRQDARRRIHAALAAVAGQVWKGLGGASEWAVLQAHAKIAIKTGKLMYQASVREVAEEAGLTSRAVSAVHRRLGDKEWLRLIRGARNGTANLWALEIPPGVDFTPGEVHSHSQSPYTPEGGREIETGNGTAPGLGADAFRWRGLGQIGLGKSTLRVWQVLGEEPSKPERLAAVLGIKRRMVQHHLARLAEHGLAVRDADGWRRGARDLVEVAAAIGTIGTGDAQRLKHKREREAYGEYRTARVLYSK